MMRLLRPPHSGIFWRSFRLHSAHYARRDRQNLLAVVHCAAQSLLRASPGRPSMVARATHASHPRDGDHQSDRLLAVERRLNASGLRSRYPSAMHAMHIYQILNHYTSRQELDPGFRVLDSLVSDSRNTVHSNYFIAKPRFWRAWLAVNERMFAIAETPSDALGEALRTPTRYRGGSNVQMKIFIMERIATWLLTRDRSFAAQVRDPFVARARIYKLPVAVVCDALKIAYATQGRPQYKDVFLLVRGLRRFLNLQIRLGGALGFRHVRPCLRVLKSYWLD